MVNRIKVCMIFDTIPTGERVIQRIFFGDIKRA